MGRIRLIRSPLARIAAAAIVITSLVSVSGCTAAPLLASASHLSPSAEPFSPAPIHILGRTDSDGTEVLSTCASDAVQVAVNNAKPLHLAGCTGDLSSAPPVRLTLHVGDTARIINRVGDPLGGVVASGTALAYGVVASGTALERDASLFSARSVGTSTVRLTRGFRCFDASTYKRLDLAECPLVTLTIEK